MKKYYKRKGGSATALPMKYFNVSAQEPDASAGSDLLKAIPPLGIRPRIGGKRKTRRILKKNHKGGFVPSVMGGFVEATSKYIVPIALFAGYKLITRKGTKKIKQYTRRR
jgi:hypothetical protein